MDRIPDDIGKSPVMMHEQNRHRARLMMATYRQAVLDEAATDDPNTAYEDALREVTEAVAFVVQVSADRPMTPADGIDVVMKLVKFEKLDDVARLYLALAMLEEVCG